MKTFENSVDARKMPQFPINTLLAYFPVEKVLIRDPVFGKIQFGGVRRGRFSIRSLGCNFLGSQQQPDRFHEVLTVPAIGVDST